MLGTPDIIDDLALLGVLDGKIAVGSMNRGGLRGAAFEMDDRYTGYDVETVVASGLDAAKLLLRVNLGDPGTVRTIEESARAVTASAHAKLPIMLEPFMSQWVDGRVVNDLSADAVITSVGIASGLGASSAYSWLKLPVVNEHGAGHGIHDAADTPPRRRHRRRSEQTLCRLGFRAGRCRACTGCRRSQPALPSTTVT